MAFSRDGLEFDAGSGAPRGHFLGTCESLRFAPRSSVSVASQPVPPRDSSSSRLCAQIRVDVREVFVEVLSAERSRSANNGAGNSAGDGPEKLLQQVLEQQKHFQTQLDNLLGRLPNLLSADGRGDHSAGPSAGFAGFAGLPAGGDARWRGAAQVEQAPMDPKESTGGTCDEAPDRGPEDIEGSAPIRQASQSHKPLRVKPTFTWLETLLNNGLFNGVCTLVILAHSVWMAIQTEWAMGYATDHTGQGSDPSVYVLSWMVEAAFLSFYSFELFLKVLCWRIHCFTGPEGGWHSFDGMLIIVGVLDFVEIGGGGSFVWLRIVRVFKIIIKPLRAVKLVTYFEPLRIILMAIVRSMYILVFAGILLLCIMFMVTLVCVQGLADYLQNTPPDLVPPMDKDLMVEYWGSLGRGILTLFKSITGGGPWGPILDSLSYAGAFYSVVFLFYIAVLVIAILKMLTGIFVQTVNETAKHDQEMTVAQNLQEAFQDIDADDSGYVTRGEFDSFLDDKNSADLLQKLQISAEDASNLFSLLDTGGDGEVSIAEFIGGCKKFAGFAKNIDMVLTCHRVENVAGYVELLMHYVEQCFEHLAGHPGAVIPPRADLSTKFGVYRAKAGSTLPEARHLVNDGKPAKSKSGKNAARTLADSFTMPEGPLSTMP